MKHRGKSTGLTIVELLVVILVAVAMLVMALPTIGGARGNAGVQQSMSNLVALGVAHVLYAVDWNGRQVTWVRDDLGVYGGDPAAYNDAVGGCNNYPPYPANCQPGAVAGWSCEGIPWGYWPAIPNSIILQPMNFPTTPGTCSSCGSWGMFRVPNARPLHGYLNGRYHDPVYYAPNDTGVEAVIAGCLDEPCEFNYDPYHPNYNCNPAWSSYAMSPAAMFHHDVFRSNAAGGWQAPWQLPLGYQGPGLFQAAYPDIKTLMLEHSWVQGPPAECNPAFFGCEPYYFNMGIDSEPVTLFYDISVRLLPNAEVYAADQQVLQQTGGVDGLWHRGTPFGTEGYFIPDGYDGTPLSHHILTTDGILGRDTLSGAAPLSKPPRLAAAGPPGTPAPRRSIVSRTDRQYIRFTQPVAADE